MKNNITELYSFDIFDTLITRNMTSPNTIFYIMECLLKKIGEDYKFPQILIENFTNIRREAEIFARENVRIQYNKKEIFFNDIYNIIQYNYNLSEAQINYLKDLEIITEQNNLQGIKENIDKIKLLLSQKKEVILISDMYFSENIIRTFLINKDPVFKNIKIYVSSKYNLTKNNGLYKFIKSKYPNLHSWIHVGDNFSSDFLSPIFNNIKPIYYNFEKLLPHEKYILKKSNYNFNYQIVYGISRLLRKGNNNKYQFGCSFSGPLLYDYVKWVISQCQNIGIKNLYFVSRDGFILKNIADIIIKKQNLDLKTNYFYSSRKACRIITNKNYTRFINFIFDESSISSVLLNIYNILNISEEKILEYINPKVLTNKNLLKKELLNNINLKNIIIENNKIKIHIFSEYLKQEIPKDLTTIAFIDVNGSGRTQDITAEILNSFMNCKVYNFYINLSPVMKQFNNSIKISYRMLINNNDWMELLSRSPEGQTLRYQKIDNKVIPIKEFEQNQNLINWRFDDYLKGILDYSNSIIDFEKANGINIEIYNIYQYMQDYLKNHLDRNFANILGSISFTTFGDESKVKECAPKINLFNLFKYNPYDYISVARSNVLFKPFYKLIKLIISPKTYGYIAKDKKLAYLKIFKFKINISNLLWKEL